MLHDSIVINLQSIITDSFQLFLFAAKILLFYIIFYAALTGFFAAIFAVFYQTLEVDKPKWMLDNGLIGSNPGKWMETLLGLELATPKLDKVYPTHLKSFPKGKKENSVHLISHQKHIIWDLYIFVMYTSQKTKTHLR